MFLGMLFNLGLGIIVFVQILDIHPVFFFDRWVFTKSSPGILRNKKTRLD